MFTLANYEIQDKIGQGGMCTVYRGRQLSLDRPVAIKILNEKLTDVEDVLARFNRESLIIARLNHPNVIHVIDRGVTDEGMPYFVMEYVEGTDLSQAIKQDLLDTNRKLDLAIQVCRALSYAHKNGVIHRDIKPGNILIDREGNVRVLDFGIAKFYDEGTASRQFTRADLVMGTLAYMSPEQQDGLDHVTQASDLYSLGVILYEMFTGTKPSGHFRRPSQINTEVSPALEQIILKCLEPDPAQRFSSADEIKDRLLTLLQGAHLQTAQRERAGRVFANVQDKFSLLDVIEETAQGAVYLYQDRAENRLLVIKKVEGSSAGLNEARLLTTLKHQNIVNILGASGDQHRFITVMEYLSGGSLKDRLLQPIPWGTALRTARGIGDALLFAHNNRMVHGNLRPGNVLFTDRDVAKVTDFGFDEREPSAGGRPDWYNIWGETKSPAADVFAAGTIFHQMLTGALPAWKGFAFTPEEYFQHLPEQLRDLVTRMLSYDPRERPAGFGPVLTQIDLLLAACEADPDLPGATEIISLAGNDAGRSAVGHLWNRMSGGLTQILRRGSERREAA
jgi:eukaryotic-like serine/threonine-protein kinase